MPRHRRPPALAALALVAALAAGAPAAGSAPMADDPAAAFTVWAAPGCAADLSRATDPCPGLGVAPPPTARTTTPPSPCTSVLPLFDDRCEAWVARHSNPGASIDQPTSDLGGTRLVAAAPDSRTLFVAATLDLDPGSGQGAVDLDLGVQAVDVSTGAVRWTTRTADPGSDVWAEHVVADPDGSGVYVLGNGRADGGSCTDFGSILAVEAAGGAVRWTFDEEPGTGCMSLSTAIVEAGTLIVVGTLPGDGGVPEQVALGLDTATGALRWRARSGGDSGLGATGSAVAAHAGRVLVGGSILRPNAFADTVHAAWLVRTLDAATGAVVDELVWTTPLPLGQTPSNPPAQLALSPDGATLYAVGGVEWTPGRFLDITTLAFDTATGALGWSSHYDGPRPKSSFDSVWYNGPLAVSADGKHLAVAGYSTSMHGANLSMDLVTQWLDAGTGEARWVTRFTGPRELNWIPSVAVAPDSSRVYVAAPSRHAPTLVNAVYQALAYDTATGMPAWAAQHSDGHSFAQGSALTPDGKTLAVTGLTADLSPTAVTDWDIATVAYRTGG